MDKQIVLTDEMKAALRKLEWSYANNTAHVALCVWDIRALCELGRAVAAQEVAIA